MVISKIEPFIVSQKLEEEFYFSQFSYSHRTICIVKITTDEGIYGWGEGYGPANLVKAGIEFLAPLIIGKDPIQHENLWQMMYLRSFDHARRGIFLSALSAIDIALWDIKGKIMNQPVSTLLGGRKREYVNMYATGLYFTDCKNLPDTLANEAYLYKEQGYKAIKMKVGLELKQDIENINAVREAIGEDIDLMIDANHAYSLREAFQLVQAVEKYNIFWFEEPISPDDYAGYHELRTKSNIPIAGGECEYLTTGFLQLFKHRCVDIAQPDTCAAGGITEVKKIGVLAQAYGVQMTPHNWGTGIAIASNLHIVSNLDVTPGRLFEPEPLLEFDRSENILRDKLVYPEFIPKGGKLKVPENAGLGIEVNEEILQKYLVQDNGNIIIKQSSSIS